MGVTRRELAFEGYELVGDGKQGELQPPLVVQIKRLKEFLRLGRVDEEGAGL